MRCGGNGPYTGPGILEEDENSYVPSHVIADVDFIPGVSMNDGYAGEIDERSGFFKAGSRPARLSA